MFQGWRRELQIFVAEFDSLTGCQKNEISPLTFIKHCAKVLTSLAAGNADSD